jgi:hypothetical protein
MSGTCKICGAACPNGRWRYCSEACVHENELRRDRARSRIRITQRLLGRTCPVCGNGLGPRQRIYCSHSCYYRNYLTQARTKRHGKSAFRCIICNNYFDFDRAPHRKWYCGEVCAAAGERIANTAGRRRWNANLKRREAVNPNLRAERLARKRASDARRNLTPKRMAYLKQWQADNKARLAALTRQREHRQYMEAHDRWPGDPRRQACEQCGREFETVHFRKYCSRACARAANPPKPRADLFKPRFCHVCGTEIPRDRAIRHERHNRKFCSIECSQINKRKKVIAERAVVQLFGNRAPLPNPAYTPEQRARERMRERKRSADNPVIKAKNSARQARRKKERNRLLKAALELGIVNRDWK